MPVLIENLFAEQKEELIRTLSADREPAAAADAVRACLDRVRQDYTAAQDNPKLRNIAARLFAIANAAAALMTSAKETRVQVELPTRKSIPALQSSPPAEQVKRYLPVLLCIATLLMLIARGNLFMIILGLAATAGSIWQTVQIMRPKRAQQPTLPDAHADVLVDVQALIGQLDQLCVSMDRELAELAADSSPSTNGAVWTPSQYEAAQMLWEALRTQDGEYALKAVPTLLDALEQQDVCIELYSASVSHHFEAVPAAVDGQTIRPALLSGDTLLARGQVSSPMR